MYLTLNIYTHILGSSTHYHMDFPKIILEISDKIKMRLSSFVKEPILLVQCPKQAMRRYRAWHTCGLILAGQLSGWQVANGVILSSHVSDSEATHGGGRTVLTAQLVNIIARKTSLPMGMGQSRRSDSPPETRRTLS